jgi:ELWxxDGT repeat protein
MTTRFITLFLLLALPAAGQTLRLVKDINTHFEPASSNPESFAALGDAAVFSALDSETGAEPWRSDGTAAGTWRLADIFFGDRSGNPFPIAATDRLVFFSAEVSPELPRGLWVTDGTPDGTLRLTDLGIGLGDGALWVPAQRALYFAAGEGGLDEELWRTDATPAGTKPVAGSQVARNPADLTLFQGRVWFTAASPRGRALWRTDGTAAGTVMVKDFSGTGPGRLRVVGSRLLFVAPGSNGASDLWASDGTARGTLPLVRLARVLDSQVIGSRLWFVADDGRRGQELWVSDGTPGGTRVLTAFARKQAFSQLALPPTLTEGRFVFAADDGPHGAELWTTDGTARGTRLVRDVCPGACPAVLSLWRTHRGLLYWTGTNGARGAELWVSDGTAAGTRLVRDICRGGCSGDPQAPFFLADRVLFGAVDNSHGRELWSSDGTASGTVRISDFGLDEPWGIMQGAVAGGELLFAAEDGEHGTELWRSDGTETSLVLDVNDFAFGGSYPELVGTLGSRAVFFADDGVHGHELWTSDGTEAGTALVADLLPGELPFRRVSSSGEEAGGRLFFFMDNEVWRTDGTAAGTFPVTRIGEVNLCCGPWMLRAFGNRVYFGAQDASHGFELWTSDGTVAGTRMVRDLRPGGDSEPRELTVFEGQLFFTAAGEDGYRELWRSDGTEAGTVPVVGLGIFHSGAPSQLTVHDGRLWFFADDAEHGFELWSSDGTEAGTALAVEIFPGTPSLSPNFVVSLGGTLLISGFPNGGGDSAGGLWATDGTQAGTRGIGMPADGAAWIVSGGRLFYNALKPFQPSTIWTSDGTQAGTGPLIGPFGFEILGALDYAPLGDRVVFNTDFGRGLWITDGTPAGTVRVTEEGFEPFAFGSLLSAGGRVFFPAHSPQTGVEPWVVEP